jgi:hypothetical protein
LIDEILFEFKNWIDKSSEIGNILKIILKELKILNKLIKYNSYFELKIISIFENIIEKEGFLLLDELKDDQVILYIP